MPKMHNKKRNTALLYEFLVRTISSSLVEGDKKTSSTALKILKKHFRPGTELYKEFRLFNALVKTTTSSDGVNSSIISEAREAARKLDVSALDKEKSMLIRSINYMIKDENFYDQPISEYKTYATIQTLLNEWRKQPGTGDIEVLAKYENQLRTFLSSEKNSSSCSTIDETPGTSRLLMKVMMKKLNEKYSSSLNDEQRELIRAYAFSTANNDEITIKKKLEEIKDNLLESIESYAQQNSSNVYLVEKLSHTREKILLESLESIDDSTVSRFMLYSTLNSELQQEEGDSK
jgi:hypothetical protein